MVMSTAMSSEGDAVKVEGGHVSVTTISMSGPETSNGEHFYHFQSTFSINSTYIFTVCESLIKK